MFSSSFAKSQLGIKKVGLFADGIAPNAHARQALSGQPVRRAVDQLTADAAAAFVFGNHQAGNFTILPFRQTVGKYDLDAAGELPVIVFRHQNGVSVGRLVGDSGVRHVSF